MTISACGGSACIAGVSRDCGHGIFRLEGGAAHSQTRRDTNCATPEYPIFPILPRLSTKSNRAGNVARKKDRWVSRKKLPAHQAERTDAPYPAVQL